MCVLALAGEFGRRAKASATQTPIFGTAIATNCMIWIHASLSRHLARCTVFSALASALFHIRHTYFTKYPTANYPQTQSMTVINKLTQSNENAEWLECFHIHIHLYIEIVLHQHWVWVLQQREQSISEHKKYVNIISATEHRSKIACNSWRIRVNIADRTKRMQKKKQQRRQQ